MSTTSSDEKQPLRLALHVAALGVVFGDIGTSPLYTIRECFDEKVGLQPTAESVTGVLSLVFWAITIVVMTKYVFFILRADNKGEGGVLALTALSLKRAGNNTRLGGAIMIAGMIGAALFYGDGIITPAISVLGAVEGLAVISPAFADMTMPIAAVLLIGLSVLSSALSWASGFCRWRRSASGASATSPPCLRHSTRAPVLIC